VTPPAVGPYTSYIMLRPHTRATLVVGLLLAVCSGPRPLAAQGPAARTVDARQLLALAQGGLAAAVQAARGPLAPEAARNRPFWVAVDGMERALGAVTAAFTSRSPSFFDALSAGSRALAELKAVGAHATPPAASDPGVRAGLETLSAAYALLRGSYGPEALRAAQGGSLTADEARRFQVLQQAQAVLARRLSALRGQVTRAGDRRAAADLARLIAQAQSIAQADLTLAAYLAARPAAESLAGEWAGDARSAKPATRKILSKAAPQVESLATGTDVGFVFTTDLSKVDAWAPLATPVEVPASAALELGDTGEDLPGLPVATTGDAEEDGEERADIAATTLDAPAAPSPADESADAEREDPAPQAAEAPPTTAQTTAAAPAEGQAEGKGEERKDEEKAVAPPAAPPAIEEPAPAPAPPPPSF
jgi:hypothetical protein